MERDHRLVRKYFKCSKCQNLESELIHPNKFQIKCTSCGIFLNEISEKEFKLLKNKTQSNRFNHEYNNNSPYIPPQNIFNNFSSSYNRPPSRKQNQNSGNINNINNRNRFNNINNHNNQRRNQRYQSTNHYSDFNIVNNDDHNTNINNNINSINFNNDNNNINININNSSNNNNLFRNNINNSYERPESRNNTNNRREEQRERRYGQGARNRAGSHEPSHLFNLFNNMFGLFPMMNSTPIIIESRGENQPYRIYIQRQNVPQSIFDPIFLGFGGMFDNNFRDNFSSNFRSNFRGNFLNEIIRILERNQEEAARKAHPPTSESALKKLKRFPLSEKYCKKDKKGKLELPSCCICISDIELKEETVLLPCGHMFHWNCCLNWLKGNNTCPMCRFVIKD